MWLAATMLRRLESTKERGEPTILSITAVEITHLTRFTLLLLLRINRCMCRNQVPKWAYANTSGRNLNLSKIRFSCLHYILQYDIWIGFVSEKLKSLYCYMEKTQSNSLRSTVMITHFLFIHLFGKQTQKTLQINKIKSTNKLISDGVSRLGLGLETRFLESRSRWPQVSSRSRLEGFRSPALRLETLHRLVFMTFCKKFLKKRF